MHSAGLELTKLTYTRLEDNLIRHRGDRYVYILPNTTGEVMWSCNVTAIENDRERCESLLF